MTTLLEKILAIAAPHECVICGNEDNIACLDCLLGLANSLEKRCFICKSKTHSVYEPCSQCRPKSRLARLYAVGSYEGAAKKIVHKLKYDGASQAAADIARYWSEVIPSHSSERSAVSYIPTTSARARQRGYDQAELLAKAFAEINEIPLTPMVHRKNAARQVGADRLTRRLQAKDMFEGSPGLDLRGMTVYLVDDVVTTGASMSSAASLLKASGAKHVIGLAIAR